MCRPCAVRGLTRSRRWRRSGSKTRGSSQISQTRSRSQNNPPMWSERRPPSLPQRSSRSASSWCARRRCPSTRSLRWARGSRRLDRHPTRGSHSAARLPNQLRRSLRRLRADHLAPRWKRWTSARRLSRRQLESGFGAVSVSVSRQRQGEVVSSSLTSLSVPCAMTAEWVASFRFKVSPGRSICSEGRG